MTQVLFRVTANVRLRHTPTPMRRVTFTSVSDDRTIPVDALTRTLPEDQAQGYREGRQYFVDVWPVPVGEGK